MELALKNPLAIVPCDCVTGGHLGVVKMEQGAVAFTIVAASLFLASQELEMFIFRA